MLIKLVKAKVNPLARYIAFPETNNPQRIYLIDESGNQTYCSLEYYLEHFEPVQRNVFVIGLN